MQPNPLALKNTVQNLPLALLLSIALHGLIFVSIFWFCIHIHQPVITNSKSDTYLVQLEVAKIAAVSQAPQIDNIAKNLSVKKMPDVRASAKITPQKIQKEAELNRNKLEVVNPKPIKKTMEQTSQPSTASTTASSLNANSSTTGSAKDSAAQIGQLSISYEQAVLQKLEQVKNYPPRALRRRLEGEVTLQLRIASNGKVLSKKILPSATFDFFDQEVLSMVQRVGRFPAFPDDLKLKELDLTIPVSFRLRG